jgi:hypothetical protein
MALIAPQPKSGSLGFHLLLEIDLVMQSMVCGVATVMRDEEAGDDAGNIARSHIVSACLGSATVKRKGSSSLAGASSLSGPSEGLVVHLMVHEECENNDDWKRNPEQPKQRTSSEAHGSLLC